MLRPPSSILRCLAAFSGLLFACTTIPAAPGLGGMGGDGGDGGTGGTAGRTFPCTEQGIRNAIAAGGGPHSFACTGPTRVPTAAVVLIDNDVILDGGDDLIVDGDDDHRVFEVASDATVELRAKTITRGSAIVGAGLFIGTGADVTLRDSSITECAGSGGTSAGIRVSDGALLTLIDSTISRNVAFSGGGIAVGDGATANVVRSTISENVAEDDVSGGISVAGRLTMTNSTLSANSPGSIGVASDGSVTLSNTTIVGQDPELDFFRTISIASSSELTLVNSVLVGSCNSDGAISGGNNIESPGDTCGLSGVGDAVGILSVQLNLGPLQQNGGPTRTHEPDSGSVAIDAIDAADCEVEEDQRGVARPEGEGCDVGAVEVAP